MLEEIILAEEGTIFEDVEANEPLNVDLLSVSKPLETLLDVYAYAELKNWPLVNEERLVKVSEGSILEEDGKIDFSDVF